MSTLARLQAQTEKIRERANRKIYVSSDTVQAYRVANERKELLTRDHPLVLAIPDDFSSSSSSTTGLSMIDASVGPQLTWTLTSINHILRTVSKFGEPTYLFANILDNDPQAFVAVTLRKGTPPDELEHLDSVLGRVSQLHMAEKKPKQVPDAGDVMNALGKGLMGLLGISSGKSHQQRRQEEQQRQEEAERAAAAARETAAARAAGAGLGTRVNVHGRPVNDDHDVPSAPDMYGGYSNPPSSSSVGGQRADTSSAGHRALGVTDRRQAEDRLAALKAELAKEGAPPTAPDVHARPDDTYQYQQQQQHRGSWESHRPGVLSNPYTSSTDVDDTYAPSAPAASDILLSTEPYGSNRDRSAPDGRYYPTIPHDVVEDRPLGDYRPGYSSSSRDEQAAGYASPAGYEDYLGVGSGMRNPPKPGDRGYEDYLRQLQRQAHSGGGAPDLSTAEAPDSRQYQRGSAGGPATDKRSFGSQLEREAYEARMEWERAQREAQERAAAAARDDGGWGGNGRQQQQQQQQRKKEAPNWLEVLGTVFSGGPAYQAYAPDL